MNRRLLIATIALSFSSLTIISCKKDKPVTSETTEVATTKIDGSYQLDAAASKIDWKGYKIVKTESTSHFGIIMFKDGEVKVKDGKLESGKFVVDMTTLTSVDLKDDAEQKGKLEGHLKSAEFFGVDANPNASYVITKVSATDGGDYNTLLDGDLTIKGISKPVQFKANVSMNSGEVTIATEPKDVMREDYGVKFQLPVQNGVVKDEITLQIFIKAVDAK